MNHGLILVGTLALLILAALVAWDDPSPGSLSPRHATVAGLAGRDGCVVCHSAAGLEAGCRACHDEIALQLDHGTGLHGTKRWTDCAGCHPEHHGEEYDLLGEPAWDKDAFGHDHVAFVLDGAHESAACDACHKERTFLGLNQDCLSCHDDPHAREGYTNCRECHDQHAFVPAPLFDHDRHFVLRGPHAVADCAGCHRDRPRFLDVPGRNCADCHDDPHRTKWAGACTTCHREDDLHWRDGRNFVTPAVHVATGFPLGPPHADTTCAACHRPGQPYAARFAKHDVNDCASCHETPHRTGFDRDCAACHRNGDDHWHAGTQRFGRDEHALTGFTLDRPHDSVACEQCHRPGADYATRFKATKSDDCAACHDDVHKGQFAKRHESCLSCHDRHRFEPPRFTRGDHDLWPLREAHAKTECAGCHKPSATLGARRFAGTPKDCKSCHENPHGGQFRGRSCGTCHSERTFLPSRIGLKQHRTFPLTGAHQAVACNACHVEKQGVRRFAGVPASCKSCHEDVHKGQFARELKTGDCTACHLADASTFRIRPFDHKRATGHALVGAHSKADCARCHGDGRYRDTPTNCASCHTDVHRGQFRRGATTDCARCHDERGADWRVPRFDHRRTRFPLDGRHEKVSCAKCHPSVKQRDGTRVTQYRPLGRDCRSCHAFDEK